MTNSNIVSFVREAVSGYCPICLNGFNSNWEIQRCIQQHKEKVRE
jgi:hypothetical protein